ncbi:MAG TPA: HD domain-containing protein [Candidatus Magasanikbacteria bacterium]|nr:HD domain-containing protein [Candidatus Magasanikbacteria bacterium]
MIDSKHTFMVYKAKELMKLSKDPIHDLSHVKRVVTNVQKIAPSLNLSKEETEAIELAAWWHDVARVLTKQPSFVWMACIDDAVSALMLCLHSIRYGFWRQSGGIATKLILSKTFATGAVFTRLLLSKKERLMMHVLKDADQLDVMNVERLALVCELSKTSKKYFWGLQCLMLYNTRESALKMKTSVANMYVAEGVESIYVWMCEHRNEPSYVNFFGQVWIDNAIEKFAKLRLKVTAVKEIA